MHQCVNASGGERGRELICNTLFSQRLSDIHLGRIGCFRFVDRRLGAQALGCEECSDEPETRTPVGVTMPTCLHHTSNNWGASSGNRHAVIILGDLEHYLTGEREGGSEGQWERRRE